MGRWLLFAFTAPWSLTVGWGWVLLACALRLAHRMRWEGAAVLTAEWRPWTAERWRYSTTLGRGIVYHPGRRAEPGAQWTRIQHHEHVHVRQVEDLMLLALAVALIVWAFTGNLVLALALWWSGGMWQLPDFVTALLRGGDAYRDSEHERSAYAQTDLDLDTAGTLSWLERRRL